MPFTRYKCARERFFLLLSRIWFECAVRRSFFLSLSLILSRRSGIAIVASEVITPIKIPRLCLLFFSSLSKARGRPIRHVRRRRRR